MTQPIDISPLHPIEKTILTSILRSGQRGYLDFTQLVAASNLTKDQIRRGIEWLKAKHLIDVQEEESTIFSLGPDGISASESGLPERKLVTLIAASGNECSLSTLAKSLGNEFQVGLGRAKKNNWVKIEKDRVILTMEADKREAEELIIEKLSSLGGLSQETLGEKELEALITLKSRRDEFINVKHEKRIGVKLAIGAESLTSLLRKDEIESITPKLLQSGEWKNRSLRPIDVTSPAPKIYPGRKHPMRLLMDEVREVFVSLGFEEISGSMSQSALWNFDALFIPQDHSAREMQDTFYISNARANLDGFRKEMDVIKDVHEHGGNTGSLGWQYAWKEEEASRVVLRTHTTSVTISHLAKYKPEEARIFTIGRAYRNEKPNYKHNPEFFQIDGVMVGPKLNIRNLIYVISKFYSKLGFNEIKFWPTYFPYTEPSLQTMVFLKESQKWMELGGMGIFRPEVTIPLGIQNTVLAWGLSLDRLVMLRHGVRDIRELFGSNLSWLRDIQMNECY